MKRNGTQMTFTQMWRGWLALLIAFLCFGDAVDATAQNNCQLKIQSQIASTNASSYYFKTGYQSTCPIHFYSTEERKYVMDFMETNSNNKVTHGILDNARFETTRDPDTGTIYSSGGDGIGKVTGDYINMSGVSGWDGNSSALYLGTNTIGYVEEELGYDWVDPDSNQDIGHTLITIEDNYYLSYAQSFSNITWVTLSDTQKKIEWAWVHNPSAVWGSGSASETKNLSNEILWSSVCAKALARIGSYDSTWHEGAYAATSLLWDENTMTVAMKNVMCKISGFTTLYGHKYVLHWTQTTSSSVLGCATPIRDVSAPFSADLGTGEGEYTFEIKAPIIALPIVFQSISVEDAWIEDLGKMTAGGCTTCGNGNSLLSSIAGQGNTGLGSDGNGNVNFRVSLGREDDLVNAGFLSLNANSPSPLLAKPDMLFTLGVDDATTVVQNTNGTLRQILAPQALADIVVSNDFRYDIRFYVQSNGVYLTNSSPFVTWTVQNPYASTTNVNWLRITETRGGNSYTNDYVWFDANQGWTLTTGNGLKTESVSNTWDTNATTRTETRQIIDPSDSHVVSQTTSIYQAMTWGEALTIQTNGSGNNSWVTTTYTDQGLKREVLASTGSWQIYDYDSDWRVTKVYSSFLNQSPTTNSSLCRLIENTYTPASGSEDDGSYKPEFPRLVVEKLLGNEIGRTYFIILTNETRMIRCQTVGAAWNATNNLVTIAKTYPDGDFVWQTKSIQNPDGTLSMYYYSYDASTNKVITVYSGAPDGSGTNVVDGTITVTVTGNVGQTLAVTNIDIASGIVIDSKTYSNFDELGRAQRVTFLDGSHEDTSYSCCNVESVTDRNGITTTYGYDALKRQTTATRNGISKISGLDAAGNQISMTRQGTNGTQIVQNISAFDTSGFRTSSTDAMTNTTYFSQFIDGSGQLVMVTTNADSATRIETFFQDGSSKSLTSTAVHGIRYEYGVESEGGVSRLYTKMIKLNDNGTDSSEYTKTYTDMMKRKYKTVYPDSAFTKSLYNSQGHLWKQVDANGIVTLFQYNAKGEREYTAIDMNQNDTIDLNGTDRIWRTVHDVLIDHGVGVQRTRSYVWTTDSVDTSIATSVVEASVDGLQSWQSAFGLTNHSIRVCDGAGNCYTTNTLPNGNFSIDYLHDGQEISSTQFDSHGSQIGGITYSYDAYGRQNTSTDARNGTTTNTFDNADRIISTTTPIPGVGLSAEVTTRYFDSMGRNWKTTLPDSGSVTNEFFPTGERKRTYGNRTYPMEFTYDYAGRMKTMKSWKNFAENNDAATTTWNYDSQRGFMTSKRYADPVTGGTGTQGTSYTYTGGGKIATRVWARGITTSYTYDNGGNLTEVSYSDGTTPTVDYTYDRRGRQIVISDGIGNRNVSYNDDGQVLAYTYTSGNLNGLSVTNGYDNYLRRTNLVVLNTTPSVIDSTTYDHDNASRLQTVSDGTNSATYSYVENSSLVGQIVFKQSASTRMITTKSYDYLNRLTSIGSVDASSVTLGSYSYTYNEVNQRTRVDNADGTYWLYGYDSLGQVTSGHKYWSDNSEVSGQQFEYAFDDIGNRTSAARNSKTSSYTANALNQYTSRTVPGFSDIIGNATTNATVSINYQRAERKGEYFRKELRFDNSHFPVFASVTNLAVLNNGTSADIVSSNTGSIFLPHSPEAFAYDADGNLTSDGRWDYFWDGENRLVALVAKPGTPVDAMKKLKFKYDYQGRRISKMVYNWNSDSWSLGAEWRFVYDGWNLVSELDGSNNRVRSYLWGSDLTGSMYQGGVGGLIALNEGTNGSNFALFDGNGNVGGLVSAANGSVSAIYEYGPFGEVIRATGSMGKVNPMRFSTKYQDDETGFDYYGYRYLNTNLGVWLNKDPMEEQGGINLYSIVSNNAINKVDKLGLMTIGDVDDEIQSLADQLAYQRVKCCCSKSTNLQAALQALDMEETYVYLGVNTYLIPPGHDCPLEIVKYYWWDCFTAQGEAKEYGVIPTSKYDVKWQDYGWRSGGNTRVDHQEGSIGGPYDYYDSHHWNWRVKVVFKHCNRVTGFMEIDSVESREFQFTWSVINPHGWTDPVEPPPDE